MSKKQVETYTHISNKNHIDAFPFNITNSFDIVQFWELLNIAL